MAVNMEQDERIDVLHELDTKLLKTMHQTDVVVKDEEARRLKLRIVLLRDEAAALKDELIQKDGHISKLALSTDDLRNQMDAMIQTCETQDKQLRSQAREHSNLKSEIQSLGNVTSDSAKILSEKLALSRELTILKPEVEHLRSQLAHQSEVLAEKLALERQVNTLEVELANEKRTMQKSLHRQEKKGGEIEEDLRQRVEELEKKLAKEQRITQKAKQTEEKKSEIEDELRQRISDLEEQLSAREAAQNEEREQNLVAEDLRKQVTLLEKQLTAERSSMKKAKKSQESVDTALIDELRQKVEALEGDIAKEKQQREKIARESERQLAEVGSQRETLEEKLAEMKTKLRDTRLELKECRTELSKLQSTKTVETVFAEEDQITKPTAKAQARRKRQANEISRDEFLMHTPKNTDDRVKRPLKKRGLDHTLVGEKSAFSITPFLNKTINVTGILEEEESEDAPQNTSGTTQSSNTSTEATTAAVPTPAPVVVKPAPVSKPVKAVALVEKKPRGRPRTKPLIESSSAKKNMTVTTTVKAPLAEPTLHKVMEATEEADQENRSTEFTTTVKKRLELKVKATEARNSGVSTSGSEPEPKKKKRKLLGGATKTLFDNDDAEAEAAPKRPAKAPLGAKRTIGKVPMGLARGAAFAGASFSPLKRERRGVNASFLA